MPIKKLTDESRQERIGGYALLGNLRKGEPKTDPKKPGRELPFFRVVPLEGEEAAAARVHELFGDHPTQLRVLLPYDRLEAFWDTWREAYGAGGLLHRCDGETVVYALDPAEAGQPCRRKQLPKDQGGCFPVGRLYVILPDLNRLAVWCLHTTSIHDLVNISQELRQVWQDVEDLFGRGFYRGVPLLLRRVPRKISTPSAETKSGRARRTKWLVHVEIDPEWVAEAQRVLRQRALPGAEPAPAPALPARAAAAADEPHEPPAGWARSSFAPGEIGANDDENGNGDGVVEGELVEAGEAEETSEEQADAPHWSAQASLRHAGLTNWQAIVRAAAKRWTYSESDVLAFARRQYGAATPGAIPVTMAEFWADLEVWDPLAEPVTEAPPAAQDELPF